MTLEGYEGDTLRLTEDQIPAAGNKPNEGYKEGSWDVTPVAGMTISADTVFQYKYEKSESSEPSESTASSEPSVPGESTVSSEPSVSDESGESGESDIRYFATKGEGSEYTLGSGKALTFVFNRSIEDNKAFAHFTGARVDGRQMKANTQYTARSGSVILEVQPALLETLSVGKHTLTALFDDGNSVDVPFTVCERKEYKVVFDVNGHGTAPAAKNVAEGGKVARPADPTAAGYTFGGWYKDKRCSQVFDFNTVITFDITIYAKWTKNAVNRGDSNTTDGISGSTGETSGSTGGTGASSGTVPLTGDMNHVWIWILLMTVSLTAAILMGRLRRQK